MTRDNVTALVINLDRSPQRLANVADNLSKLGIPFERIPAVDGSSASKEFLYQRYDADLNKRVHFRPLKNGEIACYLSHRKACEFIVDNNLDCALVLEDDAILFEGIQEFTRNLASVNEAWDIVKLCHGPNPKTPIAAFPITDGHSITVTEKVPSGAVVHLISNMGARKFLAMSEKFGRPVDQDIRHWWLYDLRVFGVSKTLASHAEGDSDIDTISGKRKTKDYSRLKRLVLKLKFFIGYSKNKLTVDLIDDVAKSIKANRAS